MFVAAPGGVAGAVEPFMMIRCGLDEQGAGGHDPAQDLSADVGVPLDQAALLIGERTRNAPRMAGGTRPMPTS